MNRLPGQPLEAFWQFQLFLIALQLVQKPPPGGELLLVSIKSRGAVLLRFQNQFLNKATIIPKSSHNTWYAGEVTLCPPF